MHALHGALPSSAARVEIDVGERVDALAWLAAQRPSVRVAFVARDGSVAFAGVGAALALPGLFGHDRVVESLPDGARLFFASRFDAAVSPSPSWKPFGAST